MMIPHQIPGYFSSKFSNIRTEFSGVSARDTQKFDEKNRIKEALGMAILACESQDKIHYAMPVHCMLYDGLTANVKHFFTLLGKMFFTSYGKELFIYHGKQIFTSQGKHLFTRYGKQTLSSAQPCG